MTASRLSPAAATAHDTDEVLVERLAQGDEAADLALRTLHQRYAALVFTVAARMLDTGAAEEVVQDVFVTLWRKHGTFDPARGAFKGWIAQVARHRALNELRRRRGVGEHSDDALAALADGALEPDEAQWLAHRRAVIQAAIEALPPDQRQALSLAFFDELTHEQIASTLKTPIGTTKTRIRLALKRLAPALLLVVASAVALVVTRRRQERAALHDEALRMVTASDVVPLRLLATDTVPADAHGTFRARPGSSVAVLTTTHLPALTGAERYLGWERDAAGWRLLGPVVVEADGRSLTVSAVDPRKGPALELRVTREAGGPADVPGGNPVLTWSATP